MKYIFQIVFILFIWSCKNKYQQAFEEFEGRQYWAWYPIDTIGNLEEIELFSLALIHQPNYLDLYYYRAQEYEQLGKLELAKQDYETCINKGFKAAKIYQSKGRCEMKLENYQLAYEAFKNAEWYCIEEWKLTPESFKNTTHWGNEYEYQEQRLQFIRALIDKTKAKLEGAH